MAISVSTVIGDMSVEMARIDVGKRSSAAVRAHDIFSYERAVISHYSD